MTRFDRDWLLSGATLWLLVGVAAFALLLVGTAIQLVTGGIDAGGVVNTIGVAIFAAGIGVGAIAFLALLWRLG
jgi:hypothetical protein